MGGTYAGFADVVAAGAVVAGVVTGGDEVTGAGTVTGAGVEAGAIADVGDVAGKVTGTMTVEAADAGDVAL